MNANQRARRQLIRFLAASPLMCRPSVSASSWQTTLQPDPLISAPDEAINVFDFEAVARERLPVAHYGFLATGAGDEATLRANREGFNRYQLRVRRLVDVRDVDMSVSLFGGTWAIRSFWHQ